MTKVASIEELGAPDLSSHRPMAPIDQLLLLAVMLALLVFPFVNILHFALPIRDIAGKSGWLVWVTAVLVVCYLLATRPWSSRDLWDQRYILAATIILCGVTFVRSIAYGESMVPINFRFVVIAIVSVSLSAAFIRRGALNALTFVLGAQGILVSLLIYTNMNYFSHILIASDESGLTGIIFNGERTRSMLMNASIGSNAIVASMFVLVCWVSRREFNTLGQHIVIWTTLLFMAYCVSLTGTRYPMIASIAVLLLAFWLLPKRVSLIGMAIAIPLLPGISVVIDSIIAFTAQAIVFVAQLNSPAALGQPGASGGTSFGLPDLLWPTQTDALPNLRIDQDSGGRVEKLLLAIQMITNGPINMLIGASAEEIRTTRSVGQFVFSDNSFGTILLEVGVPAGLLLIAAWAAYLRRYAKNLVGAAFAAYFVGALCFTNAILWDSWVSSVFFMFPVIYALGGRPFGTPRDREQPGRLTAGSGA